MKFQWLLTNLLLLAISSPGLTQEKKELRWGTDPVGGGPYVYKDEQGRFVGFEVELAEYLARELGRTSKMVTGDWDKLPELLDKAPGESGIDIVLNGYELRADLQKQYPATRPYYIYRLALIIHKDHAATFTGWGDLMRRKPDGTPHTVGVLGGSVAHEYMQSRAFRDTIDLKINPDVATVMGLVEQKRLDATVQDTPAARFYVRRSRTLMVADEPRKSGFYVILTRPGDHELREQLNQAITKGIRTGALKAIYEKYGVWNEDQERLLHWAEHTEWPPPLESSAEESVEEAAPDVWQLFGELLSAAGMTVFLSFTSFPIAMILGMIVALGRVYGAWYIRFPCSVYVEFLRGTPLLLQLYFVYYLLPKLIPGLDFTPVQAGIVGLAINYSAYEAENYRAGLLAIPRGQMEAALALGMSPWTALRVVIIPQAFRIVLPPVTNDFIALFKDTSVCSVILITELTRKYNELYNFNREYVIELAFLTAGLYLLMSYPLALVAQFLEKRLSRSGGESR